MTLSRRVAPHASGGTTYAKWVVLTARKSHRIYCDLPPQDCVGFSLEFAIPEKLRGIEGRNIVGQPWDVLAMQADLAKQAEDEAVAEGPPTAEAEGSVAGEEETAPPRAASGLAPGQIAPPCFLGRVLN